VEGIHHVGAALEAGWQIEAVLYSPDQLKSVFAASLIEQTATAGVRVERVSPDVMRSLAEKENPQGLLAIVAKRRTALEDSSVATWAAALLAPQNPGNLGTILRTLDAVAGERLFVLDGGVDPYHPTAVRASMGTIFTIPVIEASSEEFLAWRRAEQLYLIGSSSHAAKDYRKIAVPRPWVLALGNEQKGLPAHFVEGCDVMVALPMRGRASSLNLGSAAAVLLYEFTQRGSTSDSE